ncbi:MAG: hypothetical protein CDJEALGM_00992 [Ignavibacteria bacterium]|nr:hypothetical protein [Ignavibacteria bacterium]
MADKSNQKKPGQSGQNTPPLSEGEKFWNELKAQGYSTGREGQAFIMPLGRLRPEMKPTKSSKKR